MRSSLVILFIAFSSVLFSQSKITELEHYEKIDSFQIGDRFINPGSFSLNIYKTIYISVKSEIILRIYDDSTNKMVSEYFKDTLEYGKYFIDFEEELTNMKSGIYRIEMNASATEDHELFPEKILIVKRFVFLL